MSIVTDNIYRQDTIYEETDGFFYMENGRKIWFDTAREAKEASGLTRVYTLYVRGGRK